MNIILLSGGSGTRLWPLSNEVRSKQFLKIFNKEDGIKESMAQRMLRMLRLVDEGCTITIATSENQIPQIRTQLGDSVDISVEPCRRDTFPAILLAATYLKNKGVGEDEATIVCPVDPYVDVDYFECLKKIGDEVKKGTSKLVLMGIKPTYPSEKYGYIIPIEKRDIADVKEFKEKPDKKKAVDYISQGALWNGGVFAFKLGYLLEISRKQCGTDVYDELYKKYNQLEKISFDYAVVEKESSVRVVRFNGDWKDLGTWNTLTEAMSEAESGNVISAMCDNTHIINELGLPLVALGLKDTIVTATPDGILVSDKETSSQLKKYVEKRRPMYERRLWGEYRVLDYNTKGEGNITLVKELVISEGNHISYQYHHRRTEVWTITQGEGELILEGEVKKIVRGDVTVIKPGMKHAIKAITELHIIETQFGDELSEDDIIRLDWDW